jgi:hypothetical protein
MIFKMFILVGWMIEEHNILYTVLNTDTGCDAKMNRIESNRIESNRIESNRIESNRIDLLRDDRFYGNKRYCKHKSSRTA